MTPDLHQLRYPSHGRGRLFWLTALVLFIAAVAARSLYLDSFPALIHNDESATAVYIAPAFLKERPDPILYGFNNYGAHPNFGAWLTSLYIKGFGESSVWSIRMGSMVCGSLSILFFALFVRNWLGPRMTLLFLASVLPFHLHLHYSRTGFIYIHATLFIALVTYLFGRFVKKPTVLRSLILGLTLGLALLVYSATQVLPAAVGLGALVFLFSRRGRETLGNRAGLKALALLLVMGIGFFAAIGQHIMFILENGYRSRLLDQLVIKSEGMPHWVQCLGPAVPKYEVYFINLLKTLGFFTTADASNQYGCGAQLEIIAGIVALFGTLTLMVRAVRLDACAIYIVTLATATILGSALMVEANFSPHFVVYGLLIPFACALGVDGAFQAFRLRSPWIIGLVSLGLFGAWSKWNVDYYLALNAKRKTLDTLIHHLPIPRESLKSMANFTTLITDFGESFYTLRYPAAKGYKSPSENPTAQTLEFITSKECPCLVVVQRAHSEGVAQALGGAGRKFQRFPQERVEAEIFYIE